MPHARRVITFCVNGYERSVDAATPNHDHLAYNGISFQMAVYQRDIISLDLCFAAERAIDMIRINFIS